MAKEIEYRYLIEAKDVPDIRAMYRYQILQGYLTNPKKDEPAIRVRAIVHPDFYGRSLEEGFITVKGPKVGASCDEYEYEIPYTDAMKMLKMCNQRLVAKDRVIIPGSPGKHPLIELDIFQGYLSGLIIAEIEVESEDIVITPPDWCKNDITKDHRYSNVMLATKGKPDVQYQTT